MMVARVAMQAQTREEDWIFRHDIGPCGRAPRLALVANLQGGELNGLFVLARLATFLRGIEAGRWRGLRLRERVIVVPTANAANLRAISVKQFGRKQPEIKTVARDLTESVVNITQSAYYRVNVHTASTDLEEMPQVRVYTPSDDERASACLFGLPAVIERPLVRGGAPNLMRAWHPHGGENFAVYAGRAGNLQPGHCETLFRALVTFMDRVGIIEGLDLAEEEDDLHYFSLNQMHVVHAEQSGIFSSRLEVGRWVQAGEEIGQGYDGFTGETQARIVAPRAGLLTSLRRQPLLYEGDLVARIMIVGTDQSGSLAWLAGDTGT